MCLTDFKEGKISLTPKDSKSFIEKLPMFNVLATDQVRTKKKAADLEEDKSNASPNTRIKKGGQLKARERPDGPFSEQNTV